MCVGASQAVCSLQADLRWCLTGTPITNGVADAYGLLRFLRIRPWWDWSEFNGEIARYESKDRESSWIDRSRSVSPDSFVCSQPCYSRFAIGIQRLLASPQKDSMLDGKKLVELPTKTYHAPEVMFSEDEQQIYNFLQTRSQVGALVVRLDERFLIELA